MNIILYIVDSLRADYVSAYENSPDITPNLHRFAKNNVLFEKCYTPSTWTRPVAASLLTGWYPPAHKTRTRSDTLPDKIPVLSERLSSRGFRTVCVSAMGNISSATKFDRGFDEMIEVYKQPSIIEKRQNTSARDERLTGESKNILAYPRAEDVNNIIMDQISSNDDTFILAWAIDPHDPYNPPNVSNNGSIDIGDANSDEEFEKLKSLYESEIRYCDEQFGNLIKYLRDIGEYQDSIIWVAGDHGESFGERKFDGRKIRSHAGPPFEEQVHVPSILKTPNSSRDRVSSLISLVDITPTLLQMIDVGFDSYESQGAPIYPQSRSNDVVYFETQIENSKTQYIGLRNDKYKYIRLDRPGISLHNIRSNPLHIYRSYIHSNKNYLFNIKEDINERKNIYQEHVSVATTLNTQLLNWLEDCSNLTTGKKDVVDDSDLESQLEALGYK